MFTGNWTSRKYIFSFSSISKPLLCTVWFAGWPVHTSTSATLFFYNHHVLVISQTFFLNAVTSYLVIFPGVWYSICGSWYVCQRHRLQTGKFVLTLPGVSSYKLLQYTSYVIGDRDQQVPLDIRSLSETCFLVSVWEVRKPISIHRVCVCMWYVSFFSSVSCHVIETYPATCTQVSVITFMRHKDIPQCFIHAEFFTVQLWQRQRRKYGQHY